MGEWSFYFTYAPYMIELLPKFLACVEKTWHSHIFCDIMITITPVSQVTLCINFISKERAIEVNGIGRFRKSKNYDKTCCF